MIVVLKIGYTQDQLNEILNFLKVRGLKVTISHGKQMCVIGVIGDTTLVDPDEILAFSYIEKVMNVSEPYKKANRLFHPADTIVDVNGSKVGGKFVGIMAGPCSVESEEQIIEVAKAVKKSGANFLRGGAFKPRTSPYSFQGLELEGLELLKIAKQETGLPIVTELMSVEYLDRFVEDVDVKLQNVDLQVVNEKCCNSVIFSGQLFINVIYKISSGSATAGTDGSYTVSGAVNHITQVVPVSGCIPIDCECISKCDKNIRAKLLDVCVMENHKLVGINHPEIPFPTY